MTDVSFSANNMEAIQQDQSLPHGPELAPIDTSVLGQPVIIQKTKAKKE